MLDETDLPLAGVRVLDLTTVIFGPYAGQILGDLGAEVIKIEAPGGDQTRHVGPERNPDMGALFMGCNRNKLSIVLDLKREEPREALWRLIETADVFMHNIRPQKIRALGFAPKPVMARNPRLVYAALNGYREAGPYGGRPAYDDVVQGESGLAGMFEARDGAPTLVPSIVADKTSALIACNGVLGALLRRARTGEGAHVECAMFEALAGYNLVEHQFGTMFRPPLGPAGYTRAMSKHRRAHPTRDGFICMLAYTDRQWAAFWRIADRPDLAADPRFASMAARARNIDSLYETASALMADRDTADWLALLREAEIPAGPVNRMEDLRDDPHLREIGFFRPYEHPTEGPLELPDAPWLFDGESLPVRHGQPRLGEHGRTLLTELGYSEREIDGILDDAAARD